MYVRQSQMRESRDDFIRAQALLLMPDVNVMK